MTYFEKIKIISVIADSQKYHTNITLGPTFQLYEHYCILQWLHNKPHIVGMFNKFPFIEVEHLNQQCNKTSIVNRNGLDLDKYDIRPVYKIQKFVAKMKFSSINKKSFSQYFRTNIKKDYPYLNKSHFRDEWLFDETEGLAYFSTNYHTGEYKLYRFKPTIRSALLHYLKVGIDINSLICGENTMISEKYLIDKSSISNNIVVESLREISYTDFPLEYYLTYDYWKIIFENVQMPEKYRQHYLTTRKPRMTLDNLPYDILLKIVEQVDSDKSLDVLPLINKKMCEFMHTIEVMHFASTKSIHKNYHNKLNKNQISYFLSLEKDDERCKLMAANFTWADAYYDTNFLFLLGFHAFDFKQNTHLIVNAQLRKGITTYFDKLETVDEETSILAIKNDITSHLDKFPITEKVALFAISKGYSPKIIANIDEIDDSWKIFFALCKKVPDLFSQYKKKYERIIVNKYFSINDKEVSFIQFLMCSNTIDIIGKDLYSPYIINTAKKYFMAENFTVVSETFNKVPKGKWSTSRNS